ncbi:MAG: peptidoglycan-binding domain-containing protein [bacterium]
MASTSILSTGSIIQNTNISGITSHEAFYIIGVTGPLNLLNNTSTNSVDSLNITNSSAITITNFSGSGHTDVNGPDIKVSSSSNIIFNNLSLTGSDKGTALSNEAGSYNIEFNVANISHYVYGVINAGGVHNLSYNNVIVAYIKYLGFMDDQNSGTVHDITYKNSVVHDAGLYFKTHTDVSEQNDGGWAVHYNAYNMYLYNCIAYNNGGSGIGYGNTSSGGVYNSIEYNNGGNWTSTGGINTARSGFYDFQSGAVNTVTGTGWTLKNNIGGGSYPVEVYGSNAGYLFNTVDYNLYYPLNTNNFQNLGGIRSWFSYHVTSGSEPNSTNTNPLFTNATNGDFTLTFLSPAIDSGTTYTGMTSTTTDFLGNPIYGTPDMGAYEYQPPHDLKLSTPDTIDIGAGARIYADGKFRDLSTTTSVSAKLKIAPQGGNFTAYDATTTRPAYLDVTGITWTNSHKVWTEGNAQTSGMITDHTIGDLNANKYYTISVTGASASTISGINGTTCLNAVCQSNGSGVLSFEYNGGYSDHTFNMQEDVTPPSAFDLVSPSDTSGTTNTAPTFSWGASSDIGSGLAKYQLYINGGLYQDNISSSVTSLGISTVSDGTYTWYIKAVDNNGNVTQSSNTYTLHIDSTAPTNVGISSITANSNSQLTILAETAIDTNSGLDNTPYHFAETSGNLGASDSIYQTSTTYIDTGLSTNTQYTYKVKAKDADSNESSYSNTVSKYTLVNNPTNLLSSSNKTSAVLSVDSFPNDTSGSSGYFFLNTNTGSTSNWIQTNSWTDTLVTCGSSYIYSVKYRNGDGTETSSISITKLTDSCATTETMVTTRRNSGGRPFILPFIPVRPANPSTGSGSSTPITTITPSTYNLGTVTLKLGSRGNAVTELQRFLNKTLNIKLTLDGKLGPKTIAIIKQWQKANGLVADGVVGVKTKKLMK